MWVIKVQKHSAGAFGQYISFNEVGERVVFGSRSKTTGKFENLKIALFGNGEFMV